MLAREIELFGAHFQAKDKGCVLAQVEDAQDLENLCFACHVLKEPISLSAASVNVFAERFAEIFIEYIRPLRIDAPWPYLFSFLESDQLGNRVKTIQQCWIQKPQKKISRVAKLAREGIPRGPEYAQGFFVYFTDFDKAFISCEAFSQGQQRMFMDQEAPARSFLKLEEAFRIFGREPQKNNTVVDLGASPGGWSYSALKRGASVVAVDNGPLREPVRSHKKIKHLKIDALTYEPAGPKSVDWLLCDILENPFTIFDLLHHWATQRWCRYFVINFKVGRMDPIPLIRDIHDPEGKIFPYCKRLVVRQLYHDREEITLIGEVN